jgi:transcription elongation factor Elf1
VLIIRIEKGVIEVEITCPNCGETLDYGVGKEFNGKVKCQHCRVMMTVEIVEGEVELVELYEEEQPKAG